MDVRAENRGRPQQKVRFFCGPGDGEKLFDPRASGRKGQECPREIQTKKFMFMLFFLPWQRCREIWREISVKFSALRFPGFGCVTENFTKFSR